MPLKADSLRRLSSGGATMSTTQSRVQRKLTTILAADAAGYSSAMDADEIGTLNALKSARAVFAKFIDRHNGRIANTAGDGLIADFPSVVEAVQCAIEVQRELVNTYRNGENGLRFRIGIHLGDVLIDGDDLLGEGVNLAARLQTMADPGGVLVSRQVYDQVHHKLSVGFQYLGEKRPKNFSEDVSVYCVSFGDEAPRPMFGRNAARSESSPREPQPVPEATTRKRRHDDAMPSDVGNRALRERVLRHAKQLGVLWIVLLVINLVTSSYLWALWPGLAMLVVLGMEAAPLFKSSFFGKNYARLAVIIAALVLINIITWSGYPWALWPAGFLIAAEVIRRIRVST